MPYYRVGCRPRRLAGVSKKFKASDSNQKDVANFVDERKEFFLVQMPQPATDFQSPALQVDPLPSTSTDGYKIELGWFACHSSTKNTVCFYAYVSYSLYFCTVAHWRDRG